MAAGDAERAPSAAQSLVESFCAVTSATSQEAAFFLESHNWALESAVRSFYDSTEGEADGDAADPVAPPVAPPAEGDGAESEDEDYVGGGAGDDEEDEDYVEDDDSDDEDAALAAAAAAAEERRRPPKRLKKGHDARGGSGSGSGSGSRPSGASGRGNVRTLSDLGGGKGGAGSDEDSDEDDEWAPPPELYTGGEKSGMVVRDRSKRKNNADEVFKQAKRKGAKQGPFKPPRKRSSRNFTGTGRLLTGETVQPTAPQPPEDIVHNICFWSNGFTVNDGPLRSFDDPENASFLESIKNSECPTELEPADGKSEVNVNLVRKEEECPESAKRAASFQGERRTLGTKPSDTTSIGAALSKSTTTKTITVDDSLPSTSLQIRFADGSRLVARFNTSHTIGDVRSFIDSRRPEDSEYTLQAGFPPKALDDANKTIEEAGVANSVIIQKL